MSLPEVRLSAPICKARLWTKSSCSSFGNYRCMPCGSQLEEDPSHPTCSGLSKAAVVGRMTCQLRQSESKRQSLLLRFRFPNWCRKAKASYDQGKGFTSIERLAARRQPPCLLGHLGLDPSHLWAGKRQSVGVSGAKQLLESFEQDHWGVRVQRWAWVDLRRVGASLSQHVPVSFL